MICRLPIDCVLAITYNCNARCTMCDIWKIKNFPELPAEEYAKLPHTLRDINISGGEPFLRRDIADVIANAAKAAPQARVVISTNGFLTELVTQQMKKILRIKSDIGVAVSIDGIGEMHDEVRGIPGGFKRDMETVQALKKLGLKNLRLAFTITERNINHFSRVYNLSRELGAQFTHSFAQSSEFYFGGKQNMVNPRHDLLDSEYAKVISAELRSWSPKRWARAYFAHGMYEFITNKKSVLSNAPGRDFFFMDPQGDIYPSVVHNVVMGNIDEVKSEKLKVKSPFEQFWCSREVEEMRKRIDGMRVPVWMVCTARTAIKKHPFRVGWWVVKEKIKM